MMKKYIILLCVIFLSVVQWSYAIGGRNDRGKKGEAPHPHAQAAQPHAHAGAAQHVSRPSGHAPSPSMSHADVRQHPHAAPHPAATTKGHHVSPQTHTPKGLSGQQLQDFRNNFSKLQQHNQQSALQTANRFHNRHPNANTWFNHDFNNRHNFHPNYNRHGWKNGWGTPGWAAAAEWAGLESSDGGYPAYYYNYYDTDYYNNYYGDLPYDQANTYSPPEQIVPIYRPDLGQERAPETEQEDWLPLGTFVVGSSAESTPYSNLVVQLALNRQGYISGTFYNAGTDQTYQIEGSVDKSSQQAVWKLSNNPDSPVAHTGLYNLTQDLVNIVVYFPKSGTYQSRVLVRVQQ